MTALGTGPSRDQPLLACSTVTDPTTPTNSLISRCQIEELHGGRSVQPSYLCRSTSLSRLGVALVGMLTIAAISVAGTMMTAVLALKRRNLRCVPHSRS